MYAFIMYSVLQGLICILGLIGNTVSFVVYANTKKKSAATVLFQGLALVDNLFLINAVLLWVLPSIYPATGHLEWAHTMFPIAGPYIWPFFVTGHTGTVWVTLLLTVNRYIAVCYPHKAASVCSIKRVRIQLICVIIAAFLYNIPRFFEYHTVSKCSNGVIYALVGYTDIGKDKLFKIIYRVIFFFILEDIGPLIILAVLNLRLVKILKAATRSRFALTASPARARKHATSAPGDVTSTGTKTAKESDSTRILIFIVLVFSIFQIPVIINNILWAALDHEDHVCGKPHFYYSKISNVLGVANSAVNFIIYTLVSKRFRDSLRPNCGHRANMNFTTFAYITQDGSVAGRLHNDVMNKYSPVKQKSQSNLVAIATKQTGER